MKKKHSIGRGGVGVFEEVVCGGTFDRFHKGHQFFLKTATKIGEKLIVGITSNEFSRKLAKQQADLIEPYEIREARVRSYLTKLHQNFIIQEINNPFSNTTTNPNHQAIVVTQDTKKTAMAINEQRAAGGLAPLVVIEAPLVLASDGKPITSTRIRLGQIDSQGNILSREEPIKNEIRRAIYEFLKARGPMYGYEIFKGLKSQFSKPPSIRLVYYHLAKGEADGLFEVAKVESVSGGYSWGKVVERIYYRIKD